MQPQPLNMNGTYFGGLRDVLTVDPYDTPAPAAGFERVAAAANVEMFRALAATVCAREALE